jgi:hypothetical protein
LALRLIDPAIAPNAGIWFSNESLGNSRSILRAEIAFLWTRAALSPRRAKNQDDESPPV